MSKAFTKEDQPEPPVVPGRLLGEGPVRLTRGALAKLEEELAQHSLGNDDHAGRARLERVREAVRRVEVVPLEGDGARVVLGARVTVVSEEEGERTVALVSPEEFDLTGEGWSVASPVGQALLGKQVGDAVTVERPKGRVVLEVVAVER